ncbi:MAG: rod shape-determining protein MreC [Chloroflexi bacterium]|nr:rod shape-determining protein MreC [Chloroflexota bacterium]
MRSRTLLAGFLLLVALGLVGLNATGMLDPLKSGALRPLAVVEGWVSSRFTAVYDFFTAPRDMQALRQRNAELELQVAELQRQLLQTQEQQAELNILRALLKYATDNPTNSYLAADVIGRDTSPFLKYITINRGSDSGLARDMPVVTNAGLVGRITEVTANAARVQLITDPDAAVNVRVQASRAEGVAVGQLAGDLSLQFIGQDAPMQVGDKVLTSGLGGSYPADVLLGEVVSLRQQDLEIFQQATVRPAVDFGRLEVVLVLTSFKPANLAPFQSTPAP